jgi:hypothetical protein
MTEQRTELPTCREVVDHLADWLEGRLPEGAAAPFATHLEVCPPCANIANTYHSLAHLARAALDVEMPPDARERLRRVLAARLCGGH